MEQTDEIQVSFLVTEFAGPPQDITALLGVQPSKSWCKGEACGIGKGRHTHNRWEFISPESRDVDFSTQLAALLDVLELKTAAVRTVAANFEAGLSVSGYVYTSPNAGVYLSPAELGRLAKLGLSLDVDLYVLTGTND